MPEQENRAKRRGRPPSPPGSVRKHRVVTFVTNSELEHLHSLSEELNAPLSTTVYQLLSECLARRSAQGK